MLASLPPAKIVMCVAVCGTNGGYRSTKLPGSGRPSESAEIRDGLRQHRRRDREIRERHGAAFGLPAAAASSARTRCRSRTRDRTARTRCCRRRRCRRWHRARYTTACCRVVRWARSASRRRRTRRTSKRQGDQRGASRREPGHRLCIVQESRPAAAAPRPRAASNRCAHDGFFFTPRVDSPVICARARRAPVDRSSTIPRRRGICRRSRYPHLPALIRAAAHEFGPKQAFTLGLPNGSQGDLTFAEVDRLSDAVRRLSARGRRVRARRSHLDPDAELPGLSGGGVRRAQGRPGDGEHQSALHPARDGAPVRRQRLGRTRHHRSVRRRRSRRCCRRRRFAPSSSCRSPICCRRSSARSCGRCRST